ncbi:sulfite exporter TauE/SafE family protein [Brucella sp. HL-2]|nr:sulfite exporter TauE/SafE family protein [Brucella sp. HL-2]MCV9907768.1 sulfite exporter TauE/SafE family protein [Brucella sp. HL-2]
MIGVPDMGATGALSLFVAAFGASALGGVLGMASGIFIVPVLTILFGIDIHAAVAASLVSVIACSCGSAAPLLKARMTNVRLAAVLETGTTLGALTGVFLIGIIPVAYLYLLFAGILVVSAQQMLNRRRDGNQQTVYAQRSWATRLGLHSAVPDRTGGTVAPYYVGSVPIGLSLMYGAGLVSALLGIGSGVLKIPAMDTALRLPIKVSSATSNFMIGVTASASAGAYFVRGDINTAIAGPVALGSVAGAFVGARMLMGFSGDKLRIFLVIVLVLLAVAMAVNGFNLHFAA